jgi:AcrR family transcriptional regulator
MISAADHRIKTSVMNVPNSSPAAPARPRGRPAAASRTDVLRAATRQYLAGERVDVLAIAGRLGLGRTTIYRWFGTREGLIGEVLLRAADPLLDRARGEARGRGGPLLLDTFDRFNRALADAPALRRFVEQERGAALRIITASDGLVQPRMVERIAELIEDEAHAGTYDPPVEPGTLAYAIVRLAEAFLFNDAAAGIRGDVDRLRDVEAALLGVRVPGRARRTASARAASVRS